MSIPLRYGTTSNIFQVSISLQCQFLLGTVQHYKIESINNNYRSLCKCQFLLGTVQRLPKLLLFFLVAMNVSIPLRYGTTQTRPTVTLKNEIILCQFLLGTVQHAFQLQVATLKYLSEFVSIPLRYGTTAVFSYYY